MDIPHEMTADELLKRVLANGGEVFLTIGVQIYRICFADEGYALQEGVLESRTAK